MATAMLCRNHEGLEAVGICRTCALKFCASCLEETGAERYCEDCGTDARGPASKQAIAAVVLGVLGLFVPLFAGLSVFLGFKSMREVERGPSPVAGAKWAKGGTILGGIGVVLWILGLVVPK